MTAGSRSFANEGAMKGIKHFRLLAVPGLLLLVLPTTAGADPRSPLIRTRVVRSNPAAFLSGSTVGDRIPLNLLDDASFIAVLDRASDDPFNGFVWEGHLDGVTGSKVLVVISEGRVVGRVSAAGREFRISPILRGWSEIAEIDVEAIQTGFSCQVELPPGEPTPMSFEASSDTVDVEEPMETTRLDLLVVYTRAAYREFKQQGWGESRKDFNSAVRFAVEMINSSMRESGVEIAFRVVGIKRTGYRESESNVEDLYRLQHPSDGYMDNIPSLRDRRGADFVTFLSKLQEDPEYGGYGFYAVTRFAFYPEWAYNWMNYRTVVLPYLTNANVLAHELGHNMGLGHERGNETAPPPQGYLFYEYSHGYRDDRNGFYTIMSYGSSQARDWLETFSSPKIKYLTPSGARVRTGNPRKAFAVKHLRSLRQALAEFRPCKRRCETSN